MRRNRALWASIIFVLVLVGASAFGFVDGGMRPTLGLDLQGGASVILTAPESTPQDVMEQALENIRNRVDAFGVGEPDIALSGTTIEVQIPGSANATVRRRDADLFCLEGNDVLHGCSEDEGVVRDVLKSLEVRSQPSQVCVVDGEGEDVECFSSRAQADTFLAGVQVGPKQQGSPSPSASASPSPSASPSAGPSPAPSSYCLTAPTGDRIGCFDTRAKAQDARDALEIEVVKRTFCVIPARPEPPPSPSASPSGSASASVSPSPSPSPTPATLADLDLAGADPLPCELGSQQEADEALGAIEVAHERQEFCVVSSAGEGLGCSVDRDQAEELQRQSGQERLLRVIGQTARLEERRVLEIVPASDPRPITCGTEEERALPRCSFDALRNEEVVYPGPIGNGQMAKYVLGPAVISGENFDRAGAVLSGQGQLGAVSEWTVTFELDSDGAERFSDATTEAAVFTSGDPQKQIAIVVDQVVISSPEVNEPITGGSGEITGGFSEQEAKDLATQLNAGALPVELTRQSVRTVSPTLGEESLHQGIIAGIAGLVLLFVYLLFYYRLLGVVAWFGMTIWAVLAVALISIAGDQVGYALSLAGVAGLVISLGVTADSYIVFFERLKDEVRSGKSPRAAVQPAFARAYKTIVAADIVAGLAAVVLYLTAVSSVRGFALTLGVATLLDLFVVYFFKRPTVFLIARNEKLVNLRGFGLTSGVAGESAREGVGL
ncbi:MAG: protein translocase subunit SecD [Actinomycetota bacterium]|nr:protein translocase subunit SecD [Actinomycetota bacterium]